MRQASPVDGTSDSLDDSHLVTGELCDESNEDSLTGRQPEVKSTEEDMRVDPSAAEAVAELEDEPREVDEVSDHASTLEAESSAEVRNSENVLELMDAEVQGEMDCLGEDMQRPPDEVIANPGEAEKHAEPSSKESEMYFNFAIEDLKQELRRLEEENQLLRSSSNESSQIIHNVLPESAGMEVEGSKLESENQQHEDRCLELVADLETLKVQLQVAHASHAQLESETVALRQDKEDKVSRLSSQIVDLERQLHELQEEHSVVLAKSKDLESHLEIIDDEKTKLKGQVASLLEDRRKREEELVRMLAACQDHSHTLKVERSNFLSTIETSNAAVRQLEEQNAAMSSEFDQKNQIAERKISDLASELQITQDQQNELHIQLQGLREENTHVVIKASNLDQLVEELKSDKLRLSSELEQLAQERERREELEAELRTCSEHIQSLEAEKLASGTLVENLITQVRELEEDNRQLTGLSNEASQSVQHLWEENTRLIEGYNSLEQEKQAHEGERMELVAGIQTVWEQLHAANDRVALLDSELRGLSERRDAEEAFFDQKVRDLESQLEASVQEKSELSSKSEEVSQVLENLRLETSQALKDLQEEKDQLVHELSEHLKQKEETEQAMIIKQNSLETQIQGLESDKALAVSMVGDLEQQLQASREKSKELEEKDVKSIQLIQELREEITRLSSEIDKLEEVKERQEGERLELAAELQAAWDQIQAVRDSESNLATELSELKEQRNEEKLRSDGLVQDLRKQIQELEERMSEAAIKVEQLSKRLNELRKEQELQDENERLTTKIVMLEQEKERILTERAVLLGETQTLQGRVESLEFDKNKMAFEIEELNQWLQGPAAEKKQLAANLDEMTQLLKGLELERNQVVTTVSELQEERERTRKDVGKLQDVINVLEEEKVNSMLVHEDLIRQFESLEEEKQQAVRIQEDLALVVQNLNEKIHVLEEESTRMVSVRDDSLLRIQGLEEEKTAMEKLLEEQSVGLNELRMENKEYVDAIGKLEGELNGRQMEVQLLKNQVSSLEEEGLSMKTVHETVLSQLLAMETAKSQVEKSVEELTALNNNSMERLHELESDKERSVRFQEEVVSMGEERSQLLRSLEESGLLVQGLHLKNSELSETISRLEEELVQEHDETQIMSGRLSDLQKDKQNYLSQHKELLARIEVMEEEMLDCSKSLEISKSALENLQAENLGHINKANLLEEKMERGQEEVQKLEEQIRSLWAVHQDTLVQMQALAEEKVELTKVLDALNLSVQKLEAENVEHIGQAEISDKVLERRQTEIQSYQDTLLQLQTLEEEKAELVKFLHASNFSVEELQGKNLENSERVRMLEEEVAQRQAEVQRLKEKVGSLSSAHQDSVLQLQVLRDEKAELVNSVDAFNLSIQELQVSNEQYSNTVKILEEDVLRRHADSQRLDQEMERLLAAHQDSLLRLQTLEEEKAELMNCLDSSNLFVQKLQAENLDHISKAGSHEEEVERKQAEVQGLEEKIASLSTAYHTSLLQLQALEEEKVELSNSRDTSDFCVQELQAKIVEQTDTVKTLEANLAERQSEIRRLEEERENLSSAHQDSLAQLEALKEEKVEFVNSLDAFNFSVQELQSRNAEHTNTFQILEDQVVRWQAEVQRLEIHTESLSTAHQSTLLQLQALAEEKDELAKALDVSNLSLQKSQADNVVLINNANSLEEEVKRRLAEVEVLEKEMGVLPTAHQDALLQIQVLEEEKVELARCLDGSNSSIQELQGKNVEHSERERMLEEEVAQWQVEVQRLEEEIQVLSTAHNDSLFQSQQLEMQKSTLINQLQECECLIQKLHSENSELVSAARNFEELYRRRDQIESLDSPVHSLDDKDFRDASEYHGVPLRGQALEEEESEASRSVEHCNILVKQSELKSTGHTSSVGINEEGQVQFDFLKADKAKCSKLLEQSELTVKKLESENMELRTTVTKLEEHLRDESQIFRDQVQSWERFEQECVAKLQCLEGENSHLVKSLEESNLCIADLHTEIDTLTATVLDLGSGKNELTNQLSLLQEKTVDIVAERDQLSSEMQAVREQLQEYVERLQESENVAKKSKEEALELAKQLETFREQVVKNKMMKQFRQLETPKQLGCTPKRNRDLVTDSEPVLDRQRLSFGQVEVSHLIVGNIDPREELQQASLGWVEIISTVCQELAKLLRSVGEEKEKLAQKQGMSHQKTEVLTNLCQELDRLILGVREKTEGFAEELSCLKHKLVKSNDERDFVGNDADVDVDGYQQIPTVVGAANRELMGAGSCEKLPSSHVEKAELEAHVANLSSCLEDSQVQLKALVIKSSTGNPYLLTSRADDGGLRKGLACFSADGNCVLNYGSELKVGRNIKAIDQEKKEKKGNATLPTFTQRTQTPSRSFKKCKVSMQQQPKRRWIF